jgi:LysM repeat protein
MTTPETLNTAPIAASRLSFNQPRAVASKPKSDFSQALQQLLDEPKTQIKVAKGDTLTAIVRAQAQAQGLKLSNNQEHRLVRQLAEANQISNPDLISPGQSINVASLTREWSAARISPAAAGQPAAALTAPLVPAALSLASRGSLAGSAQLTTTSGPAARSNANPILEGTLARAVAKGFIPPAEKLPVYDKILQMAKSHGFAPDDFARMTLMESDGMNPRASNQRCHGIIQFCDGPARGAASAGYGDNARAILGLSVYQQLNLVEKYFADVGLKNKGPVGLEDLYLSVLNPASRNAEQATTPLNIQGKQARVLHTDSNTDSPITRQSIRQGLIRNAADRLVSWLPASLGPSIQTTQRDVGNTTP